MLSGLSPELNLSAGRQDRGGELKEGERKGPSAVPGYSVTEDVRNEVEETNAGTSSAASAPQSATPRYQAVKTLYRNRISKVALCKDANGKKVIVKRYLLSQLSSRELVNVRGVPPICPVLLPPLICGIFAA